MHSYSKPLALGHKHLENLFDGVIVVQEKVDGSQLSFGVYPHEEVEVLVLRIKSRNQMIDVYNPGMFDKAVVTIENLWQQGLLTVGYTYRAEYLSKPKHNTLAYARVPEGNIILFDVDKGDCDYMFPFELQNEAERLGLECVPYFYFGEGKNLLNGEFETMLDTTSILGNVKVEGIVIKNYDRLFSDGKVMMGKLVSADFKEKHNRGWKKANPSSGSLVDDVVAEFGSEARWMKAVQHLKEQDLLVNAPQDIPLLMREFNEDFEEECAEEIKDFLWSKIRKEVVRRVGKGLPEWYKEQLNG